MKRKGFEARIKVIISINNTAVSLLRDAALVHYDGYCQSVAKVGGFLWGAKNRTDLHKGESVDISFDFRELDIMLKIIEGKHTPEYNEIRTELRIACSRIKELTEEINKTLESRN